MRIAIIGAPGSGKTTQSELLAKSLNVPVISIGEDLRDVSRGDSKEAEEIRVFLEKGELVPDEISISFLRRHLSEREFEIKKGFILDGMPRTFGETRSLMQLFAFDRVFHLRTNLSVSLERLLKRGRSDDQTKIVSRRFEIYEQENRAILEIYRNLGILVEVDASNPSVSDVHREIVSQLR